MKTTSKTTALFTILAAFSELYANWLVDEFIGYTDEQKFLLGLIKTASTVKYNPDQIKTLISKDTNVINRFLKDNGFDIALQDPIDLCVATIMDLIGGWLEKADEAIVQNEGDLYLAATIKSGISTSVISLGDNQVIKIETRNNITVFIEPNATERSDLYLFKYIWNQTKVCAFEPSPCEVTIPFISMEEKPDISWLVGIETRGNINFTISQAVQQNKLKLNCDGVHAQSAVAMGLRKCVDMSQKERIIIDQPFNLWISGKDLGGEYFPLFGAYLAPDSWKKVD